MLATYIVIKDHNYGINQTPSKTLVHCSGSASRENSVQVLVTTTNSGSERNKFLSNQNKIKPTVTGRVEMVEGEFTSSEWQTTENRNATVNHPNGCFQDRLGAVCQVITMEGGGLVISVKDKTYQCLLGKNAGNLQSRAATSSQGSMGLTISQSNSSSVEYLPCSLNIQADWQSRNHRDSSTWKLNLKIFSKIVKIRGIP